MEMMELNTGGLYNLNSYQEQPLVFRKSAVWQTLQKGTVDFGKRNDSTD